VSVLKSKPNRGSELILQI